MGAKDRGSGKGKRGKVMLAVAAAAVEAVGRLAAGH